MTTISGFLAPDHKRCDALFAAAEVSASDGEWDENYDTSAAPVNRNDDERPDIDARNTRPQTLRDHLLWQMQMTSFTPADRRIAESIIDAINPFGATRRMSNRAMSVPTSRRTPMLSGSVEIGLRPSRLQLQNVT